MYKSLLSRAYEYNGNLVRFDKVDGVTMINATQMAKPFGKQPVFWLNNQSTKEFLAELAELRNLSSADLVRVTKGGNDKNAQGTWMHEDVALEFARWLSPQFAIWCNDRIKELFKEGVVKAQRTEERRKQLAVEKETPHPAKGNRHRADYERANESVVFLKHGVAVTSSLTIARMRGSSHGCVLDTIRNVQRRVPELKTEVRRSYYMARYSGAAGCGWQKQPMYLLTRKAFAAYAAAARGLKQDALQPIIDAFDRAEAEMAKRPTSGAQPLPQTPTPPTPTPPVTAAATPTQGDMAERMIAAMAVLTGADIKKVQDIMRKGGAL